MVRYGSAAITAAIVMAWAASGTAAPIISTWNGGAGDWSTAGSWTPSGVPNNGADSFTVLIDGGKTATASTVTLDVNASVTSFTIDSGDALSFESSRTLTLGGAATNNGTMAADSASGIVLLGTNANLTNAGTMRGSGNAGSILTIRRGSANGAIQNTGSLLATNDGIVTLDSLDLNNAGGTIEAQNGSQVRLDAFSFTNTIHGGTLASSGTGFIRQRADATLDGVTNNGSFRLDTGTTTTIKGAATNNGTMAPAAGASGVLLLNSGASLDNLGSIEATGSNTFLIVRRSSTTATMQNGGSLLASGNGVLTLEGMDIDNSGGTIEARNGTQVRLDTSATTGATTIHGGTLASSGSGFIRQRDDATLDGVTNNGVLRLDDGTTTTIKGAATNNGTISPAAGATGTILLDTNASLNNLGTIQASGSNTFLNLRRTSDTAIMQNGGLLQASGNNGVLTLDGMDIDNTGGTIEALNGSQVRLDAFSFTNTIHGGTLASSGSGFIRQRADATLDGVTNNGLFRLDSGTTTTILGAVTNNGTMSPAAGASGTILLDTNASLNNLGAIQASGSNTFLNIDRSSATTTMQNGGSLHASGGGVLTLRGVDVDNSGGTIEAQTGTQVRFDALLGTGTTIRGGTLASSGTGIIRQRSDVMLDGVTNNAAYVLETSTTTTISGGTTVNNATMSRNASASAQMVVNAGATLNNGGTITVNGLNVQGTLTGTGTINAPVQNSGTVSPGNSPGILTINDTYTQLATGILDIQIGGLIAGTDYDQLVVSSTATLSGTLLINLINGFNPASDAFFDILRTFDTIVGTFDVATLPVSPTGTWDVEYLADRVRVTFDFDEDGPTPTPTPEPPVLLIVLLRGALLLARRARPSRG